MDELIYVYMKAITDALNTYRQKSYDCISSKLIVTKTEKYLVEEFLDVHTEIITLLHELYSRAVREDMHERLCHLGQEILKYTCSGATPDIHE